ncbi:HAUS augmin-like complex subunit 4 [Pyrus ussuriensis x Pyrus communis]|uniref:HAUS augmin-like complex subunit 4 n=1 Tax=Pyrus ussuriensis x Pyrus communis TaxID=2448454 RepID=A0A5N5FS78_9ROSA|nr:HAUS augmin-like complex subunit 4 [Pyrus ussuriensis x Pyrus communis]
MYRAVEEEIHQGRQHQTYSTESSKSVPRTTWPISSPSRCPSLHFRSSSKKSVCVNYLTRFCEFYYKCILHLNLRLAITCCVDDFINYSTLSAEDLMRWFSIVRLSPLPLPLVVKLISEEIKREEEALQEDLYSADRKFSEYYNVLEQMLGVLIKLIEDLNLQHQHNYDEPLKTWLCKRCETMSAKLRKLEYALVGQMYAKDSGFTHLREYQGVDPHFDQVARQYRDIVQKLENMQWTIQQVEMDLKRLPDNLNA